MEFPLTVDSQDAFDTLVKDRLGRERAKFADYDDLKAKAEGADAVKTAADAATKAALERAEAAEALVKTHDAAKEVDGWRADVAKATGVPAVALRGSTKEEFEAHAAELKPFLTGVSPVIPTQGTTPDNPAAGGDDERAAVRELFGTPGD